MPKFLKTKYPGVYYLESSTRKHGVRPDRVFYIRHKVDGKVVDERVGWWSEGMTADLAAGRLAELKRNSREGIGPSTLGEQRAENKAQRKAEEAAKAEAERASQPFKHIWQLYIEQCRTDGKKSIDREESFYRHHISKLLADKALGEIAPIHLEKLKANMVKAGNSPRSIHYCLATIRQLFNFAIKRGHYDGGNPTAKVSKPKVDNRRLRFLTVEEAEKLLDLLKKRSLNSWRITLISLHCGLRFGEIASLTWGDVDVDRNVLTIRNPKNGRTRFAPMTSGVKDALLDMEPGGRNDLIFPDRNGGKRHQMSDAFDRTVKALGFNEGVEDTRQKVIFHTMRHSFASWHAEAGVDLLTLKELLGHRSVTMVERYSHLHPDGLQAAARALSDRLQRDATSGEVLPFRSTIKSK